MPARGEALTEAGPEQHPPELILWHDYRAGSAEDRSGYENHGRIDGPVTAEGRQPDWQALRFDGVDDRVVVLPSASLRTLGGIRLTAWIWLAALGGRRTIVEGFSSFSLLIEPSGILEGTIYNGSRWEGVRSRPDLLPLQRWVRITYAYDGVDTSTLEVDGQPVGFNVRPLGTIQPVDWPFGLNVGAWPDGSRRVFAGRIAEVKLWRTLPT